VYRNVGGALESLPFWESAETRYASMSPGATSTGTGSWTRPSACESNPSPGDTLNLSAEIYFGNGSTLSSSPGLACAGLATITRTPSPWET